MCNLNPLPTAEGPAAPRVLFYVRAFGPKSTMEIAQNLLLDLVEVEPILTDLERQKQIRSYEDDEDGTLLWDLPLASIRH